MMGQGLAAQGQMAEERMEAPQQEMAEQQQGGGESQQEMVQQVAQMLMQGVSPEELIKQGVPEQVIMMAIEMLKQQMAQQGQTPEPAPQGQGLAAMAG